MPLSRLTLQSLLLSPLRPADTPVGRRSGRDLVWGNVIPMDRVRLLDIQVAFAFTEDFVFEGSVTVGAHEWQDR